MHRRTYLATFLGFGAGSGAGYYYRPTRDAVTDAAPESATSALAGSFDATADDLQLTPSEYNETGWEDFSPESAEEDPEEIDDIDVDQDQVNASEALFYNHVSGSMVVSIVFLPESIEDAEEVYTEIRSEHTAQYSLEDDLGIAPDEHGYRTGGSFVIFRVRNAIGLIGYEPTNTQPELEDAVAVAEALRGVWDDY